MTREGQISGRLGAAVWKLKMSVTFNGHIAIFFLSSVTDRTGIGRVLTRNIISIKAGQFAEVHFDCQARTPHLCLVPPAAVSN
jgi:hypothetical protein